MVKGKKGGLDVSVNSIIIVIFALITLSGGVLLINTIFNKIKIDIPSVNREPTPQEPIVIPANKIELVRGGQGPLEIKFYNDENAAISDAQPAVECKDISGVTWSFTHKPNVGVGDKATFSGTVKVDKAAPRGEYPCILKISNTETSYFVEIK